MTCVLQTFLLSLQLGALMWRLGGAPAGSEVDAAMKDLDLNGDGFIEFQEFARWYYTSEAKLRGEMHHAFDAIDRNGNGEIDNEELVNVLTMLGKHPSGEELRKIRKDLDDNKDGVITRKEFYKWYESSLFFKLRKDDAEAEVLDYDTLLPTFPKENIQAQIVYILTFPLILICYGTIPNLNKV